MVLALSRAPARAAIDVEGIVVGLPSGSISQYHRRFQPFESEALGFSFAGVCTSSQYSILSGSNGSDTDGGSGKIFGNRTAASTVAKLPSSARCQYHRPEFWVLLSDGVLSPLR